MVTLIHTENADRHLEIVLDIPEPDLQIFADENLMAQVVLNLLKNGVHAIPATERGRLIIRVQKDRRDSGVRIEIEDNGQGIPTDVAQQIFVPFFTTKENGSGIGLSISRQIMRLHHGLLTLQSSEPGRTVFMLTFSE